MNEQISAVCGSLSIKKISPHELCEMLELQKRVTDSIEDKTTYFPLTEDELTEGFEKDLVIGAYSDDRLVAFALVILNREGGLWKYLSEEYEYSELMTFDAVVVDNEYRGLGLQRALIGVAAEQAKLREVKILAATVSAKNLPSLRNFESTGFICLRKIKAYGGLDRMLMIKHIE